MAREWTAEERAFIADYERAHAEVTRLRALRAECPVWLRADVDNLLAMALAVFEPLQRTARERAMARAETSS